MNVGLLVFLVLLLLGCNPAPEANKEKASAAKRELPSKHKGLLSKYLPKSFDTLRVYSPESLTGEYAGKPLDSAEAMLFPPEIARQHFDGTPGIFAVYSFDIDQNTTGLVTRTPSEYVPSSIKLFFFDKVKDTITSYIELAELWGDAGDVWIKDAWIFKNGQQYNSFVIIQEMHHNSVDNERDTSIERQQYYHLLNLSKRGDTVRTDPGVLLARFRHLVDRVIQ